jgi:hypothetical protein
VAGDAGVVAERGREGVVVAGLAAALALEERGAEIRVLKGALERALVEQAAGQELVRLQAAAHATVG